MTISNTTALPVYIGHPDDGELVGFLRMPRWMAALPMVRFPIRMPPVMMTGYSLNPMGGDIAKVELRIATMVVDGAPLRVGSVSAQDSRLLHRVDGAQFSLRR